MFDFSTLITDRAAADLENLRALLSTPMEDWTAAQLAEFNLARSKGAYNYTDLNRVTACMEYLNERLTALGYETGYSSVVVHQPQPQQPTLPDGYTELEYIQSSGTQWISTGYTIQSETMKVILQFAYTDVHSDSTLFGSETSGMTGAGEYSICPYGPPEFYVGGSKQLPAGYTPQINEACILTIEANQGVLTDTWNDGFPHTQNYINGLNHTYPIFIFANNISGVASQFTSMKLYSFVLYDSGNLVRNFVPCINPSGAVGLYDLANGAFYANAGTGVFTAGPEIPPEPEPEPLDPYTWYEDDVPTAPQMAQYLSNVLAIWSTIMGDPTLPETMVNLTQEGANQIEAALIEINTAIEQIIAAMARSNSFTFWSGNRPFPTAYSNRGRNWAELDAMETSWRNWQVATWYLLLYGNLETEGDVT